MTNGAFDGLFGGPPRNPESRLEQRHMDLAASIQAVTEDVMLAMGREVFRETGMSTLVLAGGVALNCVANGRLLREGPFDDIWIQPAAGDAGGALGAALFVWHQLLDKPRPTQRHRLVSRAVSSARASTDGDLRASSTASARRISVRRRESGSDRARRDLLAAEKIVGWFQGRMEFGPRALGARSILGDPRSPRMQATMNLKIKFRESFRPFAPCVLQEDAHDGSRSSRIRRARTCCWSRRCSTSTACRDRRGASAIMTSDPDLRKRVNMSAVGDPGRHARRLQRAGADRRRRRAIRGCTRCCRRFDADRLPGAREHELQRPRRADRLHAAGRLSLLPRHRDGRARARRRDLLKEDMGETLDAATREQYLAQFQLD